MAKSDTPDIEHFLQALEQMSPTSEVFSHASRILDSHLVASTNGEPKAGPPGPERFLTIAMATYDDYDGVYFSAQAIRLYHPEIERETVILVLDNHPSGPGAAQLKSLEEKVHGYRYVPYDRFTGTAVKDLLFRKANSEFVLVMDAHVLFPAGVLAKLIEFLKSQGQSKDLFQGPLVSDDLKSLSSHYKPVWKAGLCGEWGFDQRATHVDAPPFEILMQGMGVFVCRKEAWPGFNPRFQGFCVEEEYAHDKIRRNGGKVICLPFLRWLHRFRRPNGVPYKMDWKDRIRNYLIGYDELGLDNAPVREHFEAHLGSDYARPLIDETLREIAGPSYAFDACFGIDGDPAQYQAAIGTPVRRVVAPKTPLIPEIGRVLAHRSILAEATRQDLHRILVLEGDPARGLAYDYADFDRALAELPETPAGIAMWLRKQGSLETFAREMKISGGFHVQAFGCKIRVAAGCLEGRTILERYVFPFSPRTDNVAGQSDVVVRIDRVAEQFQLSADGVVVATAGSAMSLVPALVRALDDAVIQRLTGFRAVHAGAVVLGKRALLLPGVTHAGKSSLVAELIRRGATYFSDEYALIDLEGRVHPYPRPLLLRNGSREQHPMLPGECRARVGDAPAPVGWILSLEYQPAGPWSIATVPQSEGLLTLLRNTPHVLSNSPEMVGAFERAVAGATCYAGSRADAADAAGQILRLADSLS